MVLLIIPDSSHLTKPRGARNCAALLSNSSRWWFISAALGSSETHDAQLLLLALEVDEIPHAAFADQWLPSGGIRMVPVGIGIRVQESVKYLQDHSSPHRA